jgi:hypothetical protein
LKIFNTWLKFISQNSSPRSENLEDALIQIILRAEIRDRYVQILQEVIFISQIATDNLIEEDDLQAEAYKNGKSRQKELPIRSFRPDLSDMPVENGTDMISHRKAAKARVMNIPPPKTMTDWIESIRANPNAKQLLETTEFKMLCSIGHIDPEGIFNTYMAQQKFKHLFHTSNGFLGMGPEGLAADDRIVLLAGSRVPVIFRQVDISKNHWRLIGPAHIPGLMSGEKWPVAQDELTYFIIV